MNEIQPSNVQYLLWSDDEDYINGSMLNKDEFSDLLDSIHLNNDLLPYGNIEDDEGRHNWLVEIFGKTLPEQIKNRQSLYSTWFIDDNNDLWCRDDSYESGTNYYLYREFNTDNETVKFAIRSSLAMDLETFDSDLIFDNTNNIGDQIIDHLELNNKDDLTDDLDDSKSASEAYVNAYDIVYMQMLTDQYLDGIFSRFTYDLDTLTEAMLKHTRQWREWDEENANFTSKMNTIDSMKMYHGIFETELKQDLYNSCSDKDEFGYDILGKNIFGKEL